MEKNFNAKIKEELKTRPNEVPSFHQDWRDLLFLHWVIEPELIQKTLPPGLFVDTFEGRGFVSVIPFFIKNFKIWKLPPLPGLTNFIEVNLRTYVYDENGIPGIWFYSLDINSFLAPQAARFLFYLPYFPAELISIPSKKYLIIQGKRKDDQNIYMNFSYCAEKGPCHLAQTGTLEFFLIERYILFSFSKNKLNFARVHHQPYPLTNAHVNSYQHNLGKINNFNISGPPQHLHFSPGVDVDIFSLKKL